MVVMRANGFCRAKATLSVPASFAVTALFTQISSVSIIPVDAKLKKIISFADLVLVYACLFCAIISNPPRNRLSRCDLRVAEGRSIQAHNPEETDLALKWVAESTNTSPSSLPTSLPSFLQHAVGRCRKT